LNQVKGYNETSFKEAQKKRLNLLTLVPDQFTPVQAAEAWGTDYVKAKTQTAKMRRWGLIIPNEGKKGRLFTKVKEA
jgi:hypothetical protein